MKRLLTTLLAAVIIVVSATAQHQLDSLFINVCLHRDGSADIQEFRTMYIGDEGTECFIKMYNLGDMSISDFSVYEDTIEYLNEGSWDIDRSRSEKAFRCGINEVPEGQELCWGVGSSGRHDYVINYKLQGLVKSYIDYDGFNHCFYEASDPPADYARVLFYLSPEEYINLDVTTPEGPRHFTPNHYTFSGNREKGVVIANLADTTDVILAKYEDCHLQQDSLRQDSTSVWAFGYWGTIDFVNGFVIAETEQEMEEYDRMIIMIRFKKGLFEPTACYPDKSFETDVKELAFIDSDYTLDDEGLGSKASLAGGDMTPKWVRTLALIIGGLCCFGVPFLLLFWAIFGKAIKRRRERKQVQRLLSDMPEYYHDIPLKGDLLQSRRIIRTLEPSADSSEMKLVEAYVLRLVDRNAIAVVKEMNDKGETHELFRITNPDAVQSMFQPYSQDNEFAQRLLTLLYTAAGEDHLLQPDEFKLLVKTDPVTVRSFARRLRDMNGITLRASQIKKEDAQQVYGFWRYLKDFSLVGERALQEVALWKEYLTFATLFGIADQVRKDMKRIAPDLQTFDELTRHIVEDNSEMSALFSALSANIIDAATRTINYETDYERAAREAREAREARQRRYSGGGGRSSFGGGGGFSGGGGSGVR